jgi:hypothetical protein
VDKGRRSLEDLDSASNNVDYLVLLLIIAMYDAVAVGSYILIRRG